jgi:four helix bundle protein
MKPARHYTDLIVWQLGEAIRIEVFSLTKKSRFNADFKARDQVEDAANSVTRNIAEGFGCETHGEFARFLEIGRRSLNEIHDVLHGAELKKYVASKEFAPLFQAHTERSAQTWPAAARSPIRVRAQAGSRADRTEKRRGSHRQESLVAPTSVRRIAPTNAKELAPTIDRVIAPI